MEDIKTWNHSRKGKITGRLVKDNGDFVDIELTDYHKLNTLTTSGLYGKGEIITVRKSFLTEVK